MSFAEAEKLKRKAASTPQAQKIFNAAQPVIRDLIGEVHADGEIWSRALWDIRAALGDARATTLIVEAQFAFAVDTTFAAAAQATVDAAARLYGSSAAQATRAAFVARGILQP